MGGFRFLLPLAWRSLWRNPRRTFITMLVVCVGLWSVLTFAVLLRAWSASSRDVAIRTITGEGQIHAQGYLDDPTVAHRLPPPDAGLMAVLNGGAVSAYSARVRLSAIVQSEYKTLPVTLVGVQPAHERQISVLPAQITAGHYLSGPDDVGIVLGSNLARRLKTRVGKRVVVMVQAADGHLAERAFQVVGLFAGPRTAEDEFVFTGLKTAQRFTGIGSDLSEIAFDVSNDAALPGVLAALERAVPGADVQSWKTLEPLSYAVSTFFDQFVLMWLWIIFLLMGFGIVNTQLMAVLERTREFGLLQALGMRPRLVLLEVALESVFLVGLGVALGAVAALATVSAFPKGIDLGFLARGAELAGAGHILYPVIVPSDFVTYSLMVWVLGVLATLWPARRASKVSPVEAMSHI
ncbi:MAG: ABC transporter permease [Alphaproteobacteria bacterium]|nr:ABC transporter permease [Alphaproteobacteria bacterium]